MMKAQYWDVCVCDLQTTEFTLIVLVIVFRSYLIEIIRFY